METLKALFEAPHREQKYFLRVLSRDGIVYPYVEPWTFEVTWKVRTPIGEYPIGKSEILAGWNRGSVTIEALSMHVGTSGMIPLPKAGSRQSYDPFNEEAIISPWPLIARKFLVSSELG